MIYHQPDNSVGNYNYNSHLYTAQSYAPHFHKNLELQYVMRGEVSMSVNGSSVTARTGEAALVLSNQIHSFSVPADAQMWVAVFSGEYVPKFMSTVKGKQGDGFVFVLSGDIRRLIQEELIERESSLLMKKACFYAVCDGYLQSVTLEARHDKNDFLIGRLLDFVAQHYAEPLSLKELTALLGYEYHYCSRVLNKNYGIRFQQLVNRYRVEAALELLSATDLSITEIAARSGFQSIRNFNLVFKQHTGRAPGEYRRGD